MDKHRNSRVDGRLLMVRMPPHHVDKIHTITEQSGEAINAIVRYMIKYSLQNGYLELILPNSIAAVRDINYDELSKSRVRDGKPALELAFRVPETWHSDLKELAWETQVKDCKVTHLAGQLIMLALNSLPTEQWVAFFKKQQHITNSLIRIVNNYGKNN